MKIFIAWSGYRSQKVASAIKEWLEGVIENQIDVSLSTEIEPGQRWFIELEDKLRSANLGIICLTPENILSNWLHWEAACIAYNPSLVSSVIPYCLDLSPSEVPFPLSQFNQVEATREGSFQILRKIHRDMGRGELEGRISHWVPSDFVNKLIDLKQQFRSVSGTSQLDKFARDIVNFQDNSLIVEYIVNQIIGLHPGKRMEVFPIFICGSAAIGKSTFAKLLRNRINSDPGVDFTMDILPTDAYSMSRKDKIEKGLQGYEKDSHDLEKLNDDFKKLTVERIPVEVRPYNHPSGWFGRPITVQPEDFLLVEGVYAFHPLQKYEKGIGIYLFAEPSKVRELKFAADIMYRNKTVTNAFSQMRENYESYERNIYDKYSENAHEVVRVDGYWHYEMD